MQPLLDRLSTVLVEKFGVPRAEIHPAATLVELDLDSLALVELGVVAEKEFGVRFADDEIVPDHTLDEVVRLIVDKGADA
ncbi:phosphopantetheine-binding protein [Saccharothrix sp. NPDC042600]|uniref:acyl carrier protein n=1 Tax=Saccharothrix TaxID=2071 RepID=UPI0033C623C1|nr:phosphopantetheine-binding protein [Saccharothrix mutabilis subsp. capreolus]